jgi:hypothetical protein
MNNMTSGMEGPIMEGTWYNMQTGDSFTVQNSFFEDNEFIIQTTDGRILRYNQIQNYIKSDKPIEMPTKQITQQESLPAEVAGLLDDNYQDMILPDDMAMISGAPTSLGNLNSNNSNNSSIQNSGSPVTYATESNYNIISKALSKRDLPDFQIEIDWKSCPLKEMNMLMDLMDVEESEIIEWYLSQVDVETTTYMIKEVLKDFISKELHPAELIPESMDMSTVESIAKPKATKTKTKKK